MNKSFPCWVCKGQGSWYEAVLYDGPGGGPLEECNYCEGEGMIEIGGKVHRRIVAEKIAMEIIKFRKDLKNEWTMQELQELGNKALNLIN